MDALSSNNTALLVTKLPSLSAKYRFFLPINAFLTSSPLTMKSSAFVVTWLSGSAASALILASAASNWFSICSNAAIASEYALYAASRLFSSAIWASIVALAAVTISRLAFVASSSLLSWVVSNPRSSLWAIFDSRVLTCAFNCFSRETISWLASRATLAAEGVTGTVSARISPVYPSSTAVHVVFS